MLFESRVKARLFLWRRLLGVGWQGWSMHKSRESRHLNWSRFAGVVLAAALLSGCGEYRTLTHDQKLPSGRTVKIVSTQLAWGVEHDERFPDKDSFSLEFLTSYPNGEASAREQEAREVFELIRPLSEQWGLKIASVSSLENTERRGRTVIFNFERQPSGEWKSTNFTMTR